MRLEVDTYKDIDEISTDELCSRLEEDFGFSLKTLSKYGCKQQFTAMLNITRWLGIEPCNEQAMFMMMNGNRVLCEAVAGSGKTTFSQMAIIRNKVFDKVRGYDVLCIAYNEHAVKDMIRRHQEIVDTINGKKVRSLTLDKEIFCKTFHSYCLMWVNQFKGLLDLKGDANGIELMSDSLQMGMMRKAIEVTTKDLALGEYEVTQLTQNFITFYSAIRESQLEPEQYPQSQQYSDLGQLKDLALIEGVIRKYELAKKFKGKYDFTDILVYMKKLLEEFPQEREQIQKAYSLVLVDEYQDFTTLMRQILQLMIEPETKLICVGDGDQSIYSFRGTDSLNTVKFRDEHEDAVIVSMGKNRRCRKSIVDVGRRVIETNKVRNQKQLKHVKEGGVVESRTYRDLASQFDPIVKELKEEVERQAGEIGRLNVSLRNQCICYRNKDSSTLLAYKLLNAGVPFVIGSGVAPFKDPLDATMMGMLELLRSPENKYNIRSSLFKAVPTITSGQVNDLVNKSPEHTHFKDLAYSPELKNNKMFKAHMETLVKMSDDMKSGKDLAFFMDTLIELVKRNYWDWQREKRYFPQELEEVILNAYRVEKNYSEFMKDKLALMSQLDKANQRNNGVYLTTFHGLKGLEFNTVYVVDLENSIFPGINESQMANYSEETRLSIKQENTCIMYVVSTRAKDRIVYCWSEGNPSIYKEIVEEREVEFGGFEEVGEVGGIEIDEDDDFLELETNYFSKPEPVKPKSNDKLNMILGKLGG